MCEGYMGQYPHLYFDKSLHLQKLKKMLLVQQIYAWGKIPATRNDWVGVLINPKSIK
jgi:hypothetical protein